MLTSFQCETVAYVSDGEVYCPDCADDHSITRSQDGIIRYSAEEESPEGMYCGDCGATIVEPDEDICTVHAEPRRWRSGMVESRFCEAVLELEDARDCEFPEVDPNPPRSRWVPCSTCGARDGERCNLERHEQVESDLRIIRKANDDDAVLA